MFTENQLETIAKSELHAVIFFEGEDGTVLLDENGFTEDEDAYYCESDATPEFLESLKEEIKQITTNPVLRKAFDNYAEQTNLRANETLESRFGFDLGAERINGLGFGEAGMDEETTEILVDWVAGLDYLNLVATADCRLSGLGN